MRYSGTSSPPFSLIVEIGDVDRPELVLGRGLASAGAPGSLLSALCLLADDDRRGHRLVGVLRAVEEVGLVEGLAVVGLVDQFDQMLGRKLRRSRGRCSCCSGFSISTLTPCRFAGRGAPQLLVEVLVDEGFGDEAEGLAARRPRTSWSAGRSAASVSPVSIWVTKRKRHRVAFAGRAVELVDHAARRCR